MGSTDSSAPSAVLKTAARAAAEGAVVAALGAGLASRFLAGGPERLGLAVGVAAAWAASTAGVAWLVWARGRSWRAFWWAFGGGMALRAAALVVLAVGAYGRASVSLDVLLVSYAFAVLTLLLTLEMRHIRLK